MPTLTWTCPSCAKRLIASTKASLSSNRSRHLREEHGDGNAKRRRQDQQAARLRAVRGAAHAGSDAPSPVAAFITSPSHRDELYDQCFRECLRIGFLPSQVHRRRGMDFSKYVADGLARMKNPMGVVGVPEGLRKDTFLMWDFHANFLPTALAAFEQDKGLRAVFWLEDDTSFRKGVTAEALLEACLEAPDSIAWLAYTKKDCVPAWGSHCVGLTRSGAALARQRLNDEEAASRTAGSELSYLCGLDTWLKKGQPSKLVRAAAKSMAF